MTLRPAICAVALLAALVGTAVRAEPGAAPSSVATQDTAAAPDRPADGIDLGPRLEPRQLYTRAGAPVLIDVTAPPRGPESDDPSSAALSLALLSHDGGLVAIARDVAPGVANLAELLPLESLKRAVWMQLLADDMPVGTPLVIQPLIGRPPVRTAEATRPDGVTRYTRIVGWGDEPLDPRSTEDVALAAQWPAGEPTPWSGVRVYLDADVVLLTDRGEIRVALRPDVAPNTAWNFRQLVDGGLYDGTTFHRIVPADRAGRPFVIQGGDPTGTGDGGPGYDLPIEPSRLPHDFGVVSMARADDPDSAGSQYFICLSRAGTARLDGQYCAFAETVDGVDAILAIAAEPIADPATGRPVEAPVVRQARLVAAPTRAPGLGRPDRRVQPPTDSVDAPLGPGGRESR